MDDSQSSDIFPPNSNEQGFGDDFSMNEETCADLIKQTIAALSKDVACEVTSPTFGAFLSNIIDDCGSCICQRLNSISLGTEISNIEASRKCEFLMEVVTLLELLTNTMNSIIGSVQLSCKSMKTIPVSTGHILVAVFTHCKESESIYGDELHSYEKELKTLFQNCHNLQQVYLTILEKHLEFDLSDEEELDILVETFKVNLKMGEIVQHLDLKTMAEQWKAYIAISERYSNYLLDRDTYNDTSSCLCDMILTNIQTAEQGVIEKTILRSVKATTFMVKILMKLCVIYKNSLDKKYEHVVEMLMAVQLQNAAYLRHKGKCPKYINMVTSNVFHAVEGLICELVCDDAFAKAILQYDYRENDNPEQSLQYMLLLVSIMRCLANRNDHVRKWMSPRENVISKVFGLLPLSHHYMNADIKFIMYDTHTCGLYEYVLTHTAALILILEAEYYVAVERQMFEALMATDEYPAIMASDLWCISATASHCQMTTQQLTSLCKAYKELSKTRTFKTSPQKVHLTYTMRRLFDILPKDKRIELFNLFDINEAVNTKLWIIFGVKSLPSAVRKQVEEQTIANCNNVINKFLSNDLSQEEVYDLITNLKLASTCPFHFETSSFVEAVVNVWDKFPQDGSLKQLIVEPNQNTVWIIDLIQALKQLTVSLLRFMTENSSEHIITILRAMSSLISDCGVELKLVILDFVLTLLDGGNTNKIIATSQDFIEILLNMLTINDTFRCQLYQRIKNNVMIERTLLKCNNTDIHNVRADYKYFCTHGKLRTYRNISFQEQMEEASRMKYSHKCLPLTSSTISIALENRLPSGNFEFADFDSLLVDNDIEQPANKRLKLETNEADLVVEKIEKDVVILSKMPISEHHKIRINAICTKLKMLID